MSDVKPNERDRAFLESQIDAGEESAVRMLAAYRAEITAEVLAPFVERAQKFRRMEFQASHDGYEQTEAMYNFAADAIEDAIRRAQNNALWELTSAECDAIKAELAKRDEQIASWLEREAAEFRHDSSHLPVGDPELERADCCEKIARLIRERVYVEQRDTKPETAADVPDVLAPRTYGDCDQTTGLLAMTRASGAFNEHAYEYQNGTVWDLAKHLTEALEAVRKERADYSALHGWWKDEQRLRYQERKAHEQTKQVRAYTECTRTARAIFHWLGCVAVAAAGDCGPSVVPLRHCIDGTFRVDEVLSRAGLWTERGEG